MNRAEREAVEAVFARMSEVITILSGLAACYDDGATQLQKDQTDLNDDEQELTFEECKTALKANVCDAFPNMQTTAAILDKAADMLASIRVVGGGILT